MSKKKLNTDAIQNELSGASAFFTRPTPPPSEPAPTPPPPVQPSPTTPLPKRRPPVRQPADTRHKDSTASAHVHEPSSNQTSMKASMLASYHDSVIETIRKAVKQTGREVTFVRLTPEEKTHLADIVYTYKRQGVKTSENEISRIAISYLLEDYKANGHESMLAKVIAALLA